MAFSTRSWQILAALAAAGILVIGAYFAARGAAHPATAEASTETALLQAIATKDSDGDGLTDWEEALFGTNPNMVDTRGLGMTDGEAVAKGLIVPKAASDMAPIPSTPSSSDSATSYGLTSPAAGSLTDAFAKNFFALYVQTKQAKNGAALTEVDTASIAQEAMQQLSDSIASAPDFKSANDIVVRSSGSDALKTFAAAAEAVMKNHQANASKSELLYLQDVLQKDDATAIMHITSLAEVYRETAIGLAVLPVPQELAASDLALVNALARMSQTTNDFSRVNDDPLATMIALHEYPQAVLNLGNALIAIRAVYTNADVTLPPNTPGAAFVNIIPDIAASQKGMAP